MPLPIHKNPQQKEVNLRKRKTGDYAEDFLKHLKKIPIVQFKFNPFLNKMQTKEDPHAEGLTSKKKLFRVFQPNLYEHKHRGIEKRFIIIILFLKNEISPWKYIIWYKTLDIQCIHNSKMLNKNLFTMCFCSYFPKILRQFICLQFSYSMIFIPKKIQQNNIFLINNLSKKKRNKKRKRNRWMWKY